MFDPVDDPTQLDPNNVAWFLMGDFLRLSPQSGGLGQQDVENATNVFRVLWLSFLRD